MNKQSVLLPGNDGQWGSYISKYQPDSSQVLDNMFTANSKNFVTDQTGMIDKRQGGIEWSRTSFPEAARDTYEALFESGERHFLRVGGGVLSASTGTGLFTTITSGYSPLGYFEWATYNNRTYGCNGINPPQTYDIATTYGGVSYVFTTGKTKPMGAQAPSSAPTAGAPTAGGAVPNGAHTYKITFMYYESEESNGSPASAVQTAGAGNNTIPLTAIPIGGYGVTARNIYRDNNDGVYLLLDTLPNNTATTYNDTLAIGATPTPMPLFNDTPPTFSKIALWQDSLFITPVGETNGIRFSNAGEPDIFDPENFIICQSDDVVTALYVYNSKLYVFGLHSFGCIEGTTPDTFYYRNINNLIGCVDNRSIQVRSIVSVPTLWWLSDKGFYYSNGSTVEYGSDFIQDLVNLNLAQVNYSTNKNTQSSFSDFSGDTSSPGIDLTTSPGSVRTIPPQKSYSTTADWLGGSVVSNLKTSNGNLLEVPTKFVPVLAQGSTTGNTTISGSNLVLPANDPDESVPQTGLGAVSSVGLQYQAQAIDPARFGSRTLTSFTVHAYSTVGPSSQFQVDIYTDVFNEPGASLWSSGPQTAVFDTVTHPFVFNPSLAVFQGVRYWVVIKGLSPSGAVLFGFNSSSLFAGLGSIGVKRAQSSSPSTWTSSGGSFNMSYTCSDLSDSGTWTSAVFDSGAISNLPDVLSIVGSYPSGSSATVTLQSSASLNMSSPNTQILSNPNGNTVVTLTGLRYYRILVALTTTNNRFTPSVGSLSMVFNIMGTWISQPITATTDNTGWGTLTYTGNVPLGTTATLTIATASLIGGPYSSYGPVGSAVTSAFAKVKVELTTTSDNVTSPSISSVTLTWAITAQITSSAIDTGTTPAGFGVFQWDQITFGVGTVTAEVRTATTAPGLTGATWVSVMNGEFPALTALQFVQWRLTLSSTPDNIPEVTSVTINWLITSGSSGVRVASIFFNKTYYVAVATTGATANDTLIQLDQFNKWRIQKDTSIGTFLSYFNSLYFTDGVTDSIFNGFIAPTDNGTAIVMDVRTKAWSAENDLFLKVPRAFKVTGINTGTFIRTYYSIDRGATWIELLNEAGTTGFQTDDSLSEFVVLFVPDALTLQSGRTLMFRITSADVFPCSIINYVPSFYARRGRYLSNA